MKHFIYKTTCTVTGHYYIGLHSTEDVDDGYLGSGVWLRRSVKKYGKEAHIREIVEMLPDRETLGLREADLVDEKMLEDPLCMNLIKGGSKGFGDHFKRARSTEKRLIALRLAAERRRGTKLTDAHRAKLKEARNRRKISEQQKERCRAAHLGKPKSEAHRQAMREAHRTTRDKEAFRQKMCGRKWMHKDGEVKQARPHEIEILLQDGWKFGMKEII